MNETIPGIVDATQLYYRFPPLRVDKSLPYNQDQIKLETPKTLYLYNMALEVNP